MCWLMCMLTRPHSSRKSPTQCGTFLICRVFIVTVIVCHSHNHHRALKLADLMGAVAFPIPCAQDEFWKPNNILEGWDSNHFLSHIVSEVLTLGFTCTLSTHELGHFALAHLLVAWVSTTPSSTRAGNTCDAAYGTYNSLGDTFFGSHGVHCFFNVSKLSQLMFSNTAGMFFWSVTFCLMHVLYACFPVFWSYPMFFVYSYLIWTYTVGL